jgi:hypothetical protein
LIRNANSLKCVDVFGNSTDKNANVQQYNCNGGGNQRWEYVGAGNVSNERNPTVLMCASYSPKTYQKLAPLVFEASVASNANLAFGMVNCEQPQSRQTTRSANTKTACLLRFFKSN